MAVLSTDIRATRAWERPERERRDPTGRIVGKSAAIQTIRDLIAAVAGNHSTVLVTGENGTGKELIARTIHATSARADKPFVVVDCAALPESLLGHRLFGSRDEHIRRTGGPEADGEMPGIFRLAEGGTVFLNEIAEMSPSLQVRLLRLFEEHDNGWGDYGPVPGRVRIIAASNQRLPHGTGGLLRDDLYYRLSVVQVDVPPLRERTEDIPLLVDYFNAKHAVAYDQSALVIPPDVLRAMTSYAWPGNVRELSNVIERWYALGGRPSFDPQPRPERIGGAAVTGCVSQGRCTPGGTTDRAVPTWEQAERDLIVQALEASEGSKVKAARMLEVERHRLYRKIKKYKIVLPKGRWRRASLIGTILNGIQTSFFSHPSRSISPGRDLFAQRGT